MQILHAGVNLKNINNRSDLLIEFSLIPRRDLQWPLDFH